MALVDADNRNGARGDFAGGREKGAVSAQDGDQVAVLPQFGLVDDVAAAGVLGIDAAFPYADLVEIDGKAVLLQKGNQRVSGVLDVGRVGAGYDADVVKRAVHVGCRLKVSLSKCRVRAGRGVR